MAVSGIEKGPTPGANSKNALANARTKALAVPGSGTTLKQAWVASDANTTTATAYPRASDYRPGYERP